MSLKLFWDDPYLAELDTRIASVDGDRVTVEETIFYAFSGGQESDAGSIGGRRVIEARWEGREIIYVLESGHGLVVGDAARMEIDWGRRYRLMRLHFAAELVLELSYRAFDGIEKIGAHISEDKARIDFLWAENIGAGCRRFRRRRRRSSTRITRSSARSATRRMNVAPGRSPGLRGWHAAGRICEERARSGRSRCDGRIRARARNGLRFG